MTNKRLWQQLRLWFYLATVFAAVLVSWYGDRYGLALFIVAAVVMLLPYLERCNTCRRIVWLEKANKFGPLWIGMQCKDQGTASSR